MSEVVKVRVPVPPSFYVPPLPPEPNRTLERRDFIRGLVSSALVAAVAPVGLKEAFADMPGLYSCTERLLNEASFEERYIELFCTNSSWWISRL